MRLAASLLGGLLLLALAAEAASWAYLRRLQDSNRSYSPIYSEDLSAAQRETLTRYLSYSRPFTGISPTLGWMNQPLNTWRENRTNLQGLRADHEYSTQPAPGKLRVAAFGDSFTYGVDVPVADTWEARMEELDPRLEVLNYGVGGYGLDQSYLRYLKEGRRLRPDVVFIGYYSENLNRSLTAFWPFYIPESGLIFSKPRFVFKQGALELAPNPLPDRAAYRRLLAEPGKVLAELGKTDHWYAVTPRATFLDRSFTVRAWKSYHCKEGTPGCGLYHLPDYSQDSEGLQVTQALFDRFHAAVVRDGAHPIIVLFPHFKEMREYAASGKRPYEALIRDFSKKGYRFVDTLEAFAAYYNSRGWDSMPQPTSRHYDAAENKAVAAFLVEALRPLDRTQSRLSKNSGLEQQPR